MRLGGENKSALFSLMKRKMVSVDVLHSEKVPTKLGCGEVVK